MHDIHKFIINSAQEASNYTLDPNVVHIRVVQCLLYM